ncbi:MAG: FAD-dependent oxidoreductase [candidate division WOR-3 bacterium]|nr:FAD-dependent oxidoreductase [candidate division WOR-3 bacterium]
MKSVKTDWFVIGAGIYGLYSAVILAGKGDRVIVLEAEDSPFKRASSINQARIHHGYHYPRSIITARASRDYFREFTDKFSAAVNNIYESYYAIPSDLSLTSAEQFLKFCSNMNIQCTPVNGSGYFNEKLFDNVFLTEEYAFNWMKVRDILIDDIKNADGEAEIIYNTSIIKAEDNNDNFTVHLSSGQTIEAANVINTSYASVNQVNTLFNKELFEIKYEICEVILVKSPYLNNTGITVMDGPFFSIMPFGQSEYHSLTSVLFTPHKTSTGYLPEFDCQDNSDICSPDYLADCNECRYAPRSAREYMFSMIRKYLSSSIELEYHKSLFSIKPILKTAEIDDSRPTVIHRSQSNPGYISVLSGKISTIFELEDALL